jgi:hypothetical protein
MRTTTTKRATRNKQKIQQYIMDINTDMSKTTLMMTIITLAVILSLFVVPNTFAKSSGGDGDSDGGCGSDKPEITSHDAGGKKGDGSWDYISSCYDNSTRY